MLIQPYKIILVATNFSMLSFLVVLMIDHYKSYHNLLSWSSSFHVLCLLWLIIRGAFWLRTITSLDRWGVFSFYTLYWLPNPIQFGSFMLLPLFFTHILYPVTWKKFWHLIRPMYYFLIISLVVFQMIWALLAAIEKENDPGDCYEDISRPQACFRTEYSSNVFRGMTAICFIILSCCQGLYAWKLPTLERNYYDRYFELSPRLMSMVNILIALSFLSKGIYQIGAMFENYLLPDIPLQGSSDVDLSILITFELWEYIPTMLLVLTVTSKSLGSPYEKLLTVTGNKNRSFSRHLLWSKPSNADDSEDAMLLHASDKLHPSSSTTMNRTQDGTGATTYLYSSYASTIAAAGGRGGGRGGGIMDDEVVSIRSSENTSLASSFERSAQMQLYPQQYAHYYQYPGPTSSSFGRFETPVSLAPKSSWLLASTYPAAHDLPGNTRVPHPYPSQQLSHHSSSTNIKYTPLHPPTTTTQHYPISRGNQPPISIPLTTTNATTTSTTTSSTFHHPPYLSSHIPSSSSSSTPKTPLGVDPLLNHTAYIHNNTSILHDKKYQHIKFSSSLRAYSFDKYYKKPPPSSTESTSSITLEETPIMNNNSSLTNTTSIIRENPKTPQTYHPTLS